MSKTVDESIDQFVSFFRERFREIGGITNFPYAHQYQKMLLMSALDTLARAVSPNESNIRRRFTSFVMVFAQWSECLRVLVCLT